MAFRTKFIISVLTIFLLLSHEGRSHEHRTLLLSHDRSQGQHNRSLKRQGESEATPRAMKKRSPKRKGKKSSRGRGKKAKTNARGISDRCAIADNNFPGSVSADYGGHLLDFTTALDTVQDTFAAYQNEMITLGQTFEDIVTKINDGEVRNQQEGEEVRIQIANLEKQLRSTNDRYKRDLYNKLRSADRPLREWSRCAPWGRNSDDLLADVKERIDLSTDADLEALRVEISDVSDQVSTIRQNIVEGGDVMTYREDGSRFQKQLRDLSSELRGLDTRRIQDTLRAASRNMYYWKRGAPRE